MKKEDYCYQNCPYLKRVSESGKLPFYCELFHLFLATQKKRILRASSCTGKAFDTKESGYQLISSYQNKGINKQVTKWGFHRLNGTFQAAFVRLILKEGNEIGVQKGTPFKERFIVSTLVAQIKMAHTETDEKKPHKPDKISNLLDKLGGDFPTLMNDESKNILKNLFAVLDGSEQDLITDILSNPERAENFLKSFDEMGKGENLVKDFRRLLEEIEKNVEEEEKRRHLMSMGLDMNQQQMLQMLHHQDHDR